MKKILVLMTTVLVILPTSWTVVAEPPNPKEVMVVNTPEVTVTNFPSNMEVTVSNFSSAMLYCPCFTTTQIDEALSDTTIFSCSDSMVQPDPDKATTRIGNFEGDNWVSVSYSSVEGWYCHFVNDGVVEVHLFDIGLDYGLACKQTLKATDSWLDCPP